MNIEIQHIQTRVRTTDMVEQPLTQQQIIELVLRVIREERSYEQRVKAERRVSSGVRDEIEGEA
jgi:hypothetical protein